MDALLGLTGVALGAFGAHALGKRLPPATSAKLLESWKTAVQYQLIHAIMVSVTPVIAPQALAAPKLFSMGTLMFSGSIYALVLLPEGHVFRKLMGPTTPLGGLTLMGGWLALFLSQ